MLSNATLSYIALCNITLLSVLVLVVLVLSLLMLLFLCSILSSQPLQPRLSQARSAVPYDRVSSMALGNCA